MGDGVPKVLTGRPTARPSCNCWCLSVFQGSRLAIPAASVGGSTDGAARIVISVKVGVEWGIIRYGEPVSVLEHAFGHVVAELFHLLPDVSQEGVT